MRALESNEKWGERHSWWALGSRNGTTSAQRPGIVINTRRCFRVCTHRAAGSPSSIHSIPFAFAASLFSPWRTAMVLPEMRLVQSAIVLAEELHYARAAARLGIDQSGLTKRIFELESLLDVRLFDRNHQKVELTEAGAKFVEHARQGIAHIEDAVTAARAAPRGAENILNVGRSAYTDPWLSTSA